MISPNVYSELFEILKYMDKQIVMKIPTEILKNIKENRDIDYKTQIDKKDLFNPKNVSPKTVEVLNWLDINYWMDERKRENLKKKFYQKELEEDEIKKAKYNINVFLS